MLTTLVLILDDFALCLLQIHDNLDWTAPYAARFITQCWTILTKTTSHWLLMEDVLQPPTGILNLTCSHDCSGNGVCNLGKITLWLLR